MTQELTRQVNNLQQCLSNDKKPLGLFIGAGCPMAIRTAPDNKPLIPDIAGITNHIRKELQTCPECGPSWQTVEQHLEADGLTQPTVEHLLTHIRALRAVAGNGDARGLSKHQLDELDRRLCNRIQQIVSNSLPSMTTPYHDVAHWVDAVRRDNPVEVFTTNYDLLMEQAFEEVGVPYFDGFAGSREPFFDLRAMEEDVLPPRWARLWKLHGSVNWFQTPGKGVFRGNPTTVDNKILRVIHPSHLKYQESRRMPYLAMMDRLRAFLKKPGAVLVLCGYSFRDEHINEIIIQGLQSTQSAVAFALLYDTLNVYKEAAELAQRRPGLNLLARDRGLIGGQTCEWDQHGASSLIEEERTWIRWEKNSTSNQASAICTLGDFAAFGRFVRELTGEVTKARGALHG